MSLYKRKNAWWIDISHQGKRIQKTTGTSDKAAAQRYHDEVKANLWRVTFLKEQPEFTWLDAAMRWLEESSHKRSLKDDKMHLRWLDVHLRDVSLSQINRDLIEHLAKIKEKETKPATVNRMLALVRAILRKAEREWSWIEKAPAIRMRCEPKGRIRWLTREEAILLITELPNHLSDMAAFTLATGLRSSNVTGLCWTDVDLERGHAFVHPDQSKSNKAISVPLNPDAIAIIKKQIGKHPEFVFFLSRERDNSMQYKSLAKSFKEIWYS
jgi:integrase